MAAKTFTQKILYTGTQANYNAATKVDTALYFTSDTHKIYKGNVDMSESVRVVTQLPVSGSAANGVVYLLTALSDGSFLSANVTNDAGANWTTFALKYATSIAVDGAGDNETVATTKAIVDYVLAKIGSGGVISDVDNANGASYPVSTAKIVVTSGANVSKYVEIPGVVTKPTWNSTTRVLTIPYTAVGSQSAGSVTVDIGKDMVVTDGEYHAATEEIWLWLSTHPKSEYPNDPSIKIPVSSLIDEIQVADTDSVDMTYTTATNTISADVRLSAKSHNALSIQHSTGEEGLYISLEDYALASDLDNVTADVSDLDASIDNLYNALSGWATIPEAP